MHAPHAAAAGPPRIPDQYRAGNSSFGILTQKRPFRKVTPSHVADRPEATRTEDGDTSNPPVVDMTLAAPAPVNFARAHGGIGRRPGLDRFWALAYIFRIQEIYSV